MTTTKRILVTGCSSAAGIGAAAVTALTDAGHEVFATTRDLARVPDGLAERATIVELDLTDAASRRRCVEQCGPIDVLVNNAGFGVIGGIEQTHVEQARANMETNFLGTMGLIQEVLPVMRAAGGGHVVNVSTVFASALCPPAIGWYVATKAALETACEALAFEVAPDGIRVTNLQPGPVATELSRDYGDRAPDRGLVDALYAWVGERAPAMQTPSEVAAAIAAVVAQPPAGLAAQTGDAARAHVAAALRDPSRAGELADLRDALGR